MSTRHSNHVAWRCLEQIPAAPEPYDLRHGMALETPEAQHDLEAARAMLGRRRKRNEAGRSVLESRWATTPNTEPQKINKNNLLASTGFEPVFTVRRALVVLNRELRRC